MGLAYWLLSIFTVLFLFSADMSHRDATQLQEQTKADRQLRARQTVQYLNLINDWLYDHPQSSGVINDADLGFTSVSGLKHVIQDGRVFVYQPVQTGLLGELLYVTRGSALIGQVTNRRLINVHRNDMQVSVPAGIPDTYLVYLN